MKKVFITRKIPQIGIDLLKAQGFEVEVYNQPQPISKRELLKKVVGVDALLSLLTDKIDEEVLNAAGPQLKIVSNFAVGYDNIDLDAAKRKKILVTNTPGVLNDAVAEHTLALLLALARRIPEADGFTKSGKYTGWDPELFLGVELRRKTLGIIGVGRIGSIVAQAAALGLGLKIIYHDLKPDQNLEQTTQAEFKNLNDLLRQADFVSIHVPLLEPTRHLINQEKLKLMKPSAFLINTARGPIVEETALVAALKNKTIAGAALDVFEHEPQINSDLKKMAGVILTPHIASATLETRSEMARLAATSIIEVLEGKTPKYIV